MSTPLARLVAALIAVIFFCPGLVCAQPAYTWSGVGSDGNWSSAGNWDAAPQSGATTAIVLAGTAQATTNQDLLTPFVLNQLVVDPTATNGFLITGNQIQFAGTAPQFLQNSGGV